jgi:hypothetical protein
MLNKVKSSGLQTKTIAPTSKIMMAMVVLNTPKDSTENTMVTLHWRDSVVAETVIQCGR